MAPRDPLRKAHGLLYARALGTRKASAVTGINRTTLSRWRKADGITDRLQSAGFTGKGKLSMAVAREIRKALKRGERPSHLARRYGVHAATISKIEREILYPEPKA